MPPRPQRDAEAAARAVAEAERDIAVALVERLRAQVRRLRGRR